MVLENLHRAEHLLPQSVFRSSHINGHLVFSSNVYWVLYDLTETQLTQARNAKVKTTRVKARPTRILSIIMP